MEYQERVASNGMPTTFGKSRFGYAFDMGEELGEMEAKKSIEGVICRICYDVPIDPKITDVSVPPNL
jgi:hypothetical protein